MKYHRLLVAIVLVAIALVAVSAVVASVPIRCPLDDEGVQSAKAGAATEDPGFAGFREGRMELPTTQNPALLPKARLVKGESHDLNRDGVSEYYALANGILRVTCGHRLLWQTPDNWWVDYYFVGDSDNNGVAELNLLVWKEGSFGPNRPFWVTEEDRSVKNHLFIFTLDDHVMRPVWQSSSLDNPNYWATLMDLNDDGAQELVVVEGSSLWNR